MSKIGKKPIALPSGVTVALQGDLLTVTGPKGKLERRVPPEILIDISEKNVTLRPKGQDRRSRMLWGTTRSHLNSMVIGVTQGFSKELEFQGIGFRATPKDPRHITFSLGFSHPVEFEAPEGITLMVEKGLIKVIGSDKTVVGQTAANIRALKPPEPYKGTGIHYVGEVIRRKEGKKAAATATTT